MTYLESDNCAFEHVRCVNECEAIAIAAGYHMATGKVGVVYLQNSGLGKTVNPITSLAHHDIYSIPILLMLGWRGEPGTKDAVQHQKMGPITLKLLDLLDIKYVFLTDNETENRKLLETARNELSTKSNPFAIIIKRGIFEAAPAQMEVIMEPQLTREEAMKIILAHITADDIVVSTTGKISRELFELREQNVQSHESDFYNIGAMGCAQSVAFGIAHYQQNKRVVVLDGDAAVLMQLGAMATAGFYSPKNLYHIILDNSAHDSTGGQMTVMSRVDLEKISSGCGYRDFFYASDKDNLETTLPEFFSGSGPVLLRIRVAKGARTNLTRPSEKPVYYKSLFMNKFLGV
jgi:phosphonopyruvate decarboxylase